MKILQVFLFGIILTVVQISGYASECAVIRLDSSNSSENVSNRDLTATIGDSNFVSFRPQLKLSAWGGECTFTIDLRTNSSVSIDSVSITVMNNAGSVNIKQNNFIRHAIYKRTDGNLEWEIILDRQPDANVFESNIETSGLQFFFQDTSLIDSSTRANSIFPDSTIFSWAVFHSSQRNNYRIINNTDTTIRNYKTGKVFHIFHPKAHDSDNNNAWCNLDIDTLTDKLVITVPNKFLETATYPVSIDPTIGETSAGLWYTNTANLLYTLYYTHDAPTADGELSKVFLYSYRSNAGSACSTRGYVYDATLSNCDLIASSSIIAVTNGTTSGDAQRNEMDISGSISDDKEYMPTFRTNHNDLQVGYGFGSPGQVKYLTLNNWTATGDDGIKGQASQYDGRFAMSEDSLNNYWSNCSQWIDSVVIPLPSGQPEPYTFTLSVDVGRTYYFAIKTADEVSNWSLISNIVVQYIPDDIAPAAIVDLQ